MINISFITKNIIVSLVLLFCVIEDLRYKKIHIAAPLVSIVAFIVTDVFAGKMVIGSLMTNLLVGFIILVFAVVKKEMIGTGDGIIVIMTGLAVGGEAAFFIVMIAFGMAMIYFTLYYAVCFVRKKTTKKREIAFVPYIFAAYLSVVVGKLIYS